MAVGRISGPLLKSNLIRNGIDLAFETDLLYLDVNNQRIGIKTASPQHELDVNGTTRTTNLEVLNTANISDITITGSSISTLSQYLNIGTLDTVVYQNKLQVDSVDIEGNVISTNSSNADLELRANGTGSVNVHSDLNVDGDVYVTGNIRADGNITIGDQNTDSITINAKVASNIIPDQDDTYTLGSETNKWSDIWVANFNAGTITSDNLTVDGIDLILRQGNIIYVAENGNDSNTGTHPQDPVASIQAAITKATAGDTIHVYPGVYTEAFPIIVPVGVTIKGHGIRSVTIRPTTETRYNDAFLLNGETTVEDLTVTGFYSGGNFFEVTAAGASSVWPQQSSLTASDGGNFDFFGQSVAISGDTAIVGANGHTPSGFFGAETGSAYIFTRSDGVWTEQQKLLASDAADADRFGYSVAIDGDTAVVGAYGNDDNGFDTGSAYVFTRSGGVWTEQQKLLASDAANGERFGWSVAIDGDTAVVGAYGQAVDDSGSAYVFTRSGGTWTEQQKLTASDAEFGDFFGWSVAISGDTAVVGARDEASDSGAVYVFTRSGSVWTEQQKLTNDVRSSNDEFGVSVDIDGDTIIVGCHLDDDQGSSSGSARVFTRSGGVWTAQQKLLGSLTGFNERFGISVAIEGDTAVVGAWAENSVEGFGTAGAVYVFTRSGSTWTQQERIESNDIASADYFGYSVGIDSETVIAGAYYKDFGGAAGRSGSAYTFTRPGGTSNTTVNVGTTDQAHGYSSGGTINIAGTDYQITGATYNESTGVLEVYHTGGLSTVGNDVFLSGLTFSCNGDTRTFPDNGYAFRFATDFEVTSRSPYIKNVTVITAGSSVAAATNTPDDPRGFNAGDAGKGAYIDGAYATANSKEASMLFHSATFITPGVDAIVATNGVRIEWLNSFTYFANRSFFCYDSNAGFAYDGKTRIRLSGLSGTAPSAGQTVTFTSTDSSTVVGPLNIESVENNDILVIDGKNTDLIGFDTTPASIAFSGTGTATTIENVDVRDFGAEVRMIGSASVYGNFGLVGDGPGVIIYAIGHNLAYIGNGKEVTNDPITVIQDNEIIELNGAKVRFNSVDHQGDFRVGDLFFVDQQTGNVSFNSANFTINTTGGLTVTDGVDTTLITSTKIDTGNLRLSGNTVSSVSGPINLEADNNIINLNADVNIDGNLDVTGNITLGGNITIGDEETDTIQFVAGIDSDILPSQTSTYSLGTNLLRWSNIYVNQVDVDDIQINDNYITTTTTNADLELRANGTGEILVPNNDVQINNNLTVNGLTTLSDVIVNGDITHVGDYTQTGDISVTGSVTITQDLDVSGSAQFEEILVDDNYITTTTSNADLELRANGTGEILVPNNDVRISNNLTVLGTITVGDINAAGTITANSFTTGDILIDDNFITTTTSNSNLELRANGTGEILIPNNNVQIDNNLTVSGTTSLSNTTITGNVTVIGDYAQTGDITVTGDVTVTQDLDVSGAAQFEEILIDDNYITTTTTNADLELRANGTGKILIPNNNVSISNNLTVLGTLTVDDIVSTGTIQANNFTTGDILIDDNFITTTTSNSNLELRANGTGSIIIDTFEINNATISSSGDFTIQPGSDILVIDATSALKIPVGNTSERPTAEAGQLRFNLELNRFEGYNGTNWIQLNGVQDLDGDTKITAELTEGSNDNTIRFYVGGNIIADLTSDRFSANRVTVDDIEIEGNVISTLTTNQDLVLTANGTGSVVFDNFAFRDNTITNTVNNSITEFVNTNDGYVKFDGTYGFVLPSGDNSQRPLLAFTEVGMTRFNTELSRVEVWDGSNWVSVAGTASGISRQEAENLAFEIVLSLG